MEDCGGMEIFFAGSVNGNGNLLEDRNGGFKCMFQRTAEIDWGHMHIHPSLFSLIFIFIFENFKHYFYTNFIFQSEFLFFKHFLIPTALLEDAFYFVFVCKLM